MTTPQTDAPTLQERLRSSPFRSPITDEAADALDASDAVIADLVEALGKAAERLDASLFTNAEHAQARETIRAALAKAAALK